MNIIFREARIIDMGSPWHGQVVDIHIENDVIKQIASGIELAGAQEIRLDNLHISRGWFDASVSFGEPGFEDRETIANGLDMAARSGFSGVALQPNAYPMIDNQSQVRFVKSKSADTATALYPIGALTKGAEGTDLAELFDMKNAGAAAFGDYNQSMDNSNLLKIALQYVQDFDGLVIAFSEDGKLRGNGVANEGIVSTRLGLKGIPALAEEVAVARNLALLEYTGGRLHIPTISTAKSALMIQEAKSKGMQVTCSVAVHHLTLTDEKLENFDTDFKVTPPLRDEATRQALIEFVRNGTIDMITSDHNPIDIEHKKIEFDHALSGTIGLESAFGALLTVLPLETVVEKLTAGRDIFRIESNPVMAQSPVNLTLFNPDVRWTFDTTHMLSKSKNSAFVGAQMTGKAYGIFNSGKLVLANK